MRHYPDATHSLVDNAVENSEPRLTLTAVFAPRRLYTLGFLADQRHFVEQITGVEEHPCQIVR